MSEGLTGNLAQLPLPDLLRMLLAGGQSGRLDLAGQGARGVLYLSGGAIVHAGYGPHTGDAAARELLTWRAGQFRFEPRADAPETTVRAPLETLLASAAHITAERDSIRAAIPSTGSIARLATGVEGLVTLSALEWRAVTLVDSARTVDDLVRELREEPAVSLRAIANLVSAGLVTLDAPHETPPPPVVSMEFFRQLRGAAASAIGPLAPVIIEDEVAALGATMDAFPRDRISILVERVGAEIQDEGRRLQFQQKLLPLMRQLAA